MKCSLLFLCSWENDTNKCVFAVQNDLELEGEIVVFDISGVAF